MRIYVVLMIVFTIGFGLARFMMRADRRRDLGVGAWLAVAAPLLVGFTTNQPLYFVALAAIMVIATTRTRLDAVARSVFLLAMLPEIAWAATVGAMWIASITTVGALMIGALAAGLFRGGFRGRRWGAPEALVLTLLIIFSFADVRDYSLTVTPRAFLSSLVFYLLPFLVFSRQVFDRVEFERVVLVLSAAAIILAVMAIYEMFNGWSLYDTVMSNIGGTTMTRNLRLRAGLLRSPVSFRESTSFAVFQVVGCLATISLRPAFRSNLVWLGAVGLTILGVFAAQSRGADIGLVAGGLAMLLVRRRYGTALALLCGAAVLGSALYSASATNDQIAALIGRDAKFRDYSDYREVLLQRGLEEGMKSPLLGTSDLAIRAQLADLIQGEQIVDFVNSYLKIFLVSGLSGLAIVLLCLTAILARIWRRAPRGDIGFSRTQGFLAGALVALLVTLFFTAFWERNPIWLLLLAAGAARLWDAPRASAARVGRQARQAPPGPAGAVLPALPAS